MSRETKALVVLMVTLFTVVLALMLFSASQEAAAYNRMTGGDATTWEALFVELRVDGDR